MTRVLVIDDYDHFRIVLKMMLEDAGYSVQSASNGKIGLRQFSESPVDVVVTDIVMPEKEGLETIIELRRISRDVKIIALSGGGTVGPATYLETAKTLGADRVFKKPVAQDDLLGAIAELVA